MSWNRFILGLNDFLIIAQAGDTGGGGATEVEQPNPLASLLPMVIIGFIFYFIVMRPQLKAQKEKRQQHEQLMSNLKKNDKVVTVGGIIGTVAEVSEDRVTLKTDDSTRIRFTRNSIQELLSDRKDAAK
ncbi:MAG: preprotein translocase subunit YajC [Fuerstiella sp.]|nr:preprotein translocase subunit YajC [Fuerstiella sp.]